VLRGGTGVTTSTGSGNNVLSNSPTLVTPALGTPSSATLTNATGLPIDGGTSGTLPVLRGGTGSTTATGTGAVVLKESPILVTPYLGTPASGVLTNCSGLPLPGGITGTLPVANGGTGITSLGAGVATFLGTPSSANLAAAVTDETGSGALVFSNSPTFVTPNLGTPASGTLKNCSFPTLNQNTTGSAQSLATTNFTIQESGGKLIFKYGATTIASMDSAGVFTTISDITAGGTP
jgi:hypothetical protein